MSLATIESLTELELSDLARCELIIERGLSTFIGVGNALAEIRNRRLYRATHKTFEDYCREHWQLSRIHAYRMIEAAQVTENLLPIGNKLQSISKDNHFPLPTTESQARPLTALSPKRQREVWGRILEETGGKDITAAKVEKAVKVLTGETVNIHVSDESYEWNTPSEIIEAARSCMGGLDLDPASSLAAQQVVKAGTFYTKEDDGLSQDWFGNVWLNPPYSMPDVEKFSHKLVQSYCNGEIQGAIMLVNNATDTGWFHLLLKHCCAICFTLGRVKFWHASREALGPRQGQAIFYFGDDLEYFAEIFQQFGFILVPL